MATSAAEKHAANLAVLQRHDASVVDVLFNAAHVTLYLFQEDKGAWQKLNVEGSLFVVRRTREPQHQYIVMNRRSTDNYVEDITPKFAIQDAEPYLMYRNHADQIVGIWFYDATERVAVAQLLRDITEKLKTPATPAAPPPPSPHMSVLVPGQRKIDVAALMMAAAVSPVDATALKVNNSNNSNNSNSTVAAVPVPAVNARDRLRTRLRALVDDDAFLDSVLAILNATK